MTFNIFQCDFGDGLNIEIINTVYDMYNIWLELLNGNKSRPHTLCLQWTYSFASPVDLYNSIAIYQALSLSILINPIYSCSGCLAMTPAGSPITLFGCSMVRTGLRHAVIAAMSCHSKYQCGLHKTHHYHEGHRTPIFLQFYSVLCM